MVVPEIGGGAALINRILIFNGNSIVQTSAGL